MANSFCRSIRNPQVPSLGRKTEDQAVLLDPGKKPLTNILQDDSFREFEFRNTFLHLLFKLNRPFEVAARVFLFVISYSKALALHKLMMPPQWCPQNHLKEFEIVEWP
ncbi:CLUB [Artemisia annua]|uniref:CLUB n=1 Tax=Artemisia annua TaxID=35608 RepID=A0A2U1PBJ5_ARTAN|nr:CLUB [Artemisia annua]